MSAEAIIILALGIPAAILAVLLLRQLTYTLVILVTYRDDAELRRQMLRWAWTGEIA